MIAFLLAAAATAPLSEIVGGDETRFMACTALIKSDPAAALDQADLWAKRSKDVPAQQCLGLALVAAERWDAAAVTFEAAATEAGLKQDGRAAVLWTQAGNAALAGDNPARARSDLDHALALPTLPEPLKGEAWIDRARADVALGDLPLARHDLDEGLKRVPKDPLAWLLSATLARRQSDLPRADKDIAQALGMAPDDPSVAYEAGNIAAAAGKDDAAILAWQRAVKLGPQEPAGKAAAAMLAQAKPLPAAAAPR